MYVMKFYYMFLTTCLKMLHGKDLFLKKKYKNLHYLVLIPYSFATFSAIINFWTSVTPA